MKRASGGRPILRGPSDDDILRLHFRLVPMSADAPSRSLPALLDRPLARVVLYYVVLFAGVAALTRLVPGTLALINAPMPISGFLSPAGGPAVSGPLAVAVDPARVVLVSLIALASACILMVPVTWVYTQTRRKKGFQQSIVQTLIILPLVVAGVILLVKDSTALAFSLGGIVGAVAFRNRLRDTKDTIYIFLAIVIGVAAGVHALLVAATISVSFNVVAAIMWWTDFGRVGGDLGGAPAERRLRRAKAQANRTGGFISLLDRELLQSMTPEQLQLLAGRALARHQDAAVEAELIPKPKVRRERLLRLVVSGPVEAARRVVESALGPNVKQWEFVRAEGDGTRPGELEYRVRLRKRDDPADVVARLRSAAGALVRSATLGE